MLRAYVALVLLGIIWGTNFIYMKWATILISPHKPYSCESYLDFFLFSDCYLYKGNQSPAITLSPSFHRDVSIGNDTLLLWVCRWNSSSSHQYRWTA